MRPVRVLIVDDSATMRALISTRLRRDPEIEVVGGAGDPIQAREMIKQLNPDVLTLDVDPKTHPAWVGGVNLRKTGRLESFNNRFGGIASINKSPNGEAEQKEEKKDKKDKAEKVKEPKKRIVVERRGERLERFNAKHPGRVDTRHVPSE